MSERDGQRVIVLHQGGVLVVEDELLQGPVQVVGLREAEARGRAVDDAVLGIAVHHHRTGVATPLAALTDEEGTVPLATQHFLSLGAVDLAYIPCAFLVVGEVILILHQ